MNLDMNIITMEVTLPVSFHFLLSLITAGGRVIATLTVQSEMLSCNGTSNIYIYIYKVKVKLSLCLTKYHDMKTYLFLN
jgi:hypothetical protein